MPETALCGLRPDGSGRTFTRETLAAREKSLWRYREVLPLPAEVEPVSLGKGEFRGGCARDGKEEENGQD